MNQETEAWQWRITVVVTVDVVVAIAVALAVSPVEVAEAFSVAAHVWFLIRERRHSFLTSLF